MPGPVSDVPEAVPWNGNATWWLAPWEKKVSCWEPMALVPSPLWQARSSSWYLSANATSVRVCWTGCLSSGVVRRDVPQPAAGKSEARTRDRGKERSSISGNLSREHQQEEEQQLGTGEVRRKS